MSTRTRGTLPAPLPCTGSRLRKLTRRMTAFYEMHLRQSGLKLSQYAVLMHLSSDAQTLLQLADRLEMDRTTLTRSLKPLVDQGWVAQADGDDARQRLLVLTTAGQRVRKNAQRVWIDAQLALENRLGRDFVANLNAQLDRALLQLRPAEGEAGK